MPTLLAVAIAAALLHHTPDAAARATLDSAVARMGGVAALRAIERLKVESVTEWQRTVLDNRPVAPVSSYEWSTEYRDYTRPAWRYVRRFIGATGINEIIDVVTDSVAAMRVGGRWVTQNIAYVDERTEWFTFTPERLMLLATDAPDAKSLPDTTMGGVTYARVRATVNGFRTTLHFNRRSGGLALATFRRGQPRDFGLAPWGEMDVAIWYSRWQRFGTTPSYTAPAQLDIHRVGKPYKRVTILGVVLNPAIPAESLSVSDSLRSAYLANNGKAMWDLPVDTAKVIEEHFAQFYTPGTPTGAVKIGGKWLVIEGGSAPASMERSAAFLRKADPSSPVAGALLTAPTGSAGIAWTIDQKLTVWVTAGARPYAEMSMRGWSKPAAFTTAAAGSWIRIGTDSARVESIDIPDFPSLAVIYVPSLRWAYAFHPNAADRVAALAAQRGWTVDRLGSARNFVGVPLPK